MNKFELSLFNKLYSHPYVKGNKKEIKSKIYAKEWLDKMHKNNKEKNNATHKIWYAVNHNKIVKPKECQYCKTETKLVGHHFDYSKPLEVIWLCYSCHKIVHNGVYEKLDYKFLNQYV